MLDRLLIAFGLIVLGGLFFLAFNRYQRRRAQAATQNDATRSPAGGDRPHRGDGKPRILYFRSDHCASCETQTRLWENLDPSVRGLIEKVDVDREAGRAKAYNIMTLPTTIVMDANGDVKHINYGVVPPRKLYAQLSRA